MPEKKKSDKTLPRVRYYILRLPESKKEIVLRVEGDRAEPESRRYLMLANNHEDSLDVILKTMCADVYVLDNTDPRMLTETMFGEAEWRYGNKEEGYKYEFGKDAKRLYPEPEPEKEAEIEATEEAQPEAKTPARPRNRARTKAERQTATTDAPYGYCKFHPDVAKRRNGCTVCRQENVASGTSKYEPMCPQHGRRQKGGKQKGGARHGQQTYKPCLKCATEKVVAGDIQTSSHLDPYCQKHERRKHKNGTIKKGSHKGAQRYECPDCVRESKGLPPIQRAKLDDEETMLPIIEAEVKAAYNHDPQNRGDIVNEVFILLKTRAWTMEDLKNRDKLKEFIKTFNTQYADKWNRNGVRKSLDQPVKKNDPDSAALKEFQEATDHDPLEILEAKETVEARLNDATAHEFTAPVSEDAHETDRANGHNPQQNKSERTSLDESANGEEELIAKEAGAGE